MKKTTAAELPATLATLPTLDISTRGEVLASNVTAFRDAIHAALATVNRTPSTDEEFGRAVQDIENLKAAEKAIADAKARAIAGATPIQDLFAVLDDTAAEMRAARLDLDRTVAARKEQVKESIISEALDLIPLPPAAAARHAASAVRDAMKGRRTLDSMREATRAVALQYSSDISECDKLLAAFEAEHGPALIHDKDSLRLKRPVMLEPELARRIETHRNAVEQARLREQLAAERAERAKQEAAAAAAAAPAPARQADPEPPTAPAQRPAAVPPPATGRNAAADEWQSFRNFALQQLRPIADRSRTMTDTVNAGRAKAFGRAINEAWTLHMQ